MNGHIPSFQLFGHVVLLSHEAWGHMTSLCVLAARIAQSTPPVYVTFFVPNKVHDRVIKEVSRNFGVGDAGLNHLRIVGLYDGEDGTHSFSMEEQFETFSRSFADAYAQLQLSSKMSAGSEDIPPSPNAVILDMMCSEALRAVRRLSRIPVKIYTWIAGMLSFMLYPFSPESYGGRGDYRERIMHEVKRTGRCFEEVADEVMTSTDGSIIRVPGIPPMFDHEIHPQEMIVKGVVGFLWVMIQQVIAECDGVISNSSDVYEPEAAASLKNWFAETGREAYVVGPLLPAYGEILTRDNSPRARDTSEVEEFLTSVLQSHGVKSLLYISFGTVFWPTEPDKLWTFLDVVISMKIPFILSHASPFASIPDSVAEKLAHYKLGMLCPWSPQQTILAHPVTGWFVTHSGHNSVVEAISMGVPMICWPYHADQPFNAIRLSEILDVGFELLEVRSGECGMKPLYRTGKPPRGTDQAIREETSSILQRALGPEGARKRGNMETLRRRVLKGRREENPYWQDADTDRLVRSLRSPHPGLV